MVILLLLVFYGGDSVVASSFMVVILLLVVLLCFFYVFPIVSVGFLFYRSVLFPFYSCAMISLSCFAYCILACLSES